MFTWRRYGLAAVLIACLTGVAISSEPVQEWPVREKLVGKPDKDTGEPKKSVDVSGIACVQSDGFPRRCVVIDDELQDAQFVELFEGKVVAKSPVHLIDDAFYSEKLALDGEGVAYAEPYFYVMGSHGHPRDRKKKLDPNRDAEEIRAKIDASAKIIRFRDDDQSEIAVSTGLMPYIVDQSELRSHVDQRLDENGLTIEGIAVSHGRLYAGFRGPSVKGNKAAILAINVDALFGGAQGTPELFLLKLGEGRGVRDLAQYEDGFLILAGPSGDDEGDYSVYWWDGTTNKVSPLDDLDFEVGSKSKKPEAILALDENDGSLRVLVLFDGKGAKEGTPTVFRIKTP